MRANFVVIAMCGFAAAIPAPVANAEGQEGQGSLVCLQFQAVALCILTINRPRILFRTGTSSQPKRPTRRGFVTSLLPVSLGAVFLTRVTRPRILSRIDTSSQRKKPTRRGFVTELVPAGLEQCFSRATRPRIPSRTGTSSQRRRPTSRHVS